MNSQEQQSVVVGFAGDSGDGIQVIGQQFSLACALFGNDIQTFPDFPAEIRAPAGTIAGVSGYQLKFASKDIHTPGDRLDTLVAFNPAALLQALPKLKPGGLILVDQDKFTEKDFKKAQVEGSPIEQVEAKGFCVIQVPMTTLVIEALKDSNVSRAKQKKSKNLFALGMVSWIYGRPLDSAMGWIREKFGKDNDLMEANLVALNAGSDVASTMEILPRLEAPGPASLPKGDYRQLTGNEGLCLGALTASFQMGKELFVSGYPITPASDILHWFASKPFVTTLQAEDEMAAAGAALGASFGGAMGMTMTSGPGMDLKAEMMGLAVMTELPMVVIDVQRAGPSTGMPTKVEQADLLMAMYGRHGDCPVPVLAPATPADCYDIMIEAWQYACEYMTPVIVLSDAYLANSAQPWRIPTKEEYPTLKASTAPQADEFKPYQRDDSLKRPWVAPGTDGFEHRLGGLEKTGDEGNISYCPDNHKSMVELRAKKINNIQDVLPKPWLEGAHTGRCLMVGWGSTYGALSSALNQMGRSDVALLHLRHLHPFAKEVGEILKRFDTVCVFELNQGHLCKMLRSEFLVDAKSMPCVPGRPLRVEEVCQMIEQALEVSA